MDSLAALLLPFVFETEILSEWVCEDSLSHACPNEVNLTILHISITNSPNTIPIPIHGDARIARSKSPDSTSMLSFPKYTQIIDRCGNACLFALFSYKLLRHFSTPRRWVGRVVGSDVVGCGIGGLICVRVVSGSWQYVEV